MKTLCTLCLLGGLAVGMLSFFGCQRTLFTEDRDTLSEQKAKYFGSYETETVHAAAERRKQMQGWGWGAPSLGE